MSKDLIRIQKVFSDNGVLSRRKTEDAIAHGRISVNGRKAKIGQAVDPIKDIITLDGQTLDIRKNTEKIYIMLNKPRGYVTTMQDELGRKCVADLTSDTPEKVYPVGRLDKLSEGLLILTNDGDFANLIMHPRNHVPKTYQVTVRPDINDEQAAKLASGVTIDGRMTKPAKINVLEKEKGRVVMLMTISEGRNRQIRKMCEAVGLEVARLKRISVGPVKLGMLKPGTWRELQPSEINVLRGTVTQSIESTTAKERNLSDKFSHSRKSNGNKDLSVKSRPRGRNSRRK